jgi:Ferritin-like domain
MRHRRDLFRDAGRVGLLLGLAAAGRPMIALPERSKASKSSASETDDITLMNTALALEHEAIWAYGLAGASGLLSAKAKEVGLLFQGSHEIHRDLLADAIKRKGGEPADAKKEYKFGLPLANEKDVLELAFKLEVGAARVYLYVVDRFQDRALSAAAGRILSDEVLHATVLRSVLGRDPVPTFRLIES